MAILVFQVLKSLVVRGTAYSVGRPVFWWSKSGLYATALGSESVYLWCDPVTWPANWIAITVKPFFQMLRSLLVLSRASSTGRKLFRCSQSALCTTLDQKVCIHGLLPYKWLEHWPNLMAKLVFQVLRNLLVLDRASSACKRYSVVASQHCVPLQLDQKVCIHGLTQYKWLEHWLAFTAKPVFHVLRNLLVLDRLAFVGKKSVQVKSFSTTALGATVLGYEKYVFTISRFDQVQLVSIWTGIHGRTY